MSNNINLDNASVRVLEYRDPPRAVENSNNVKVAEVSRELADKGEFVVNEKTIISGDDLVKAIEQLNQRMRKFDRNVSFSLDKSTGKDVVRVVNSNNGEVIRQLPNEEKLNFIRNLDSMMGLIFDKNT
jgi:uncharacterized FlaG/YvyC family protein